MENGVSPEEGREQESDLIKGEAQLVLNERRGEREISAVDIVDENRKREEDGEAR